MFAALSMFSKSLAYKSIAYAASSELASDVFQPPMWADPKIWLIIAVIIVAFTIIGIYSRLFTDMENR